MGRITGSLCALSTILFLFSSCLNSDNEDVTLYSDTAITSFYISTAKIYNNDEKSSYTTNSSMSAYPFYIDQQNCTIYNVDSLPYRTDLTKLLCSYSTKNSGAVGIESATNSDSIFTLQTTDSIDFSTVRYLRVYATDNSGYRRYSVKVAAHQEKADSFQWHSVATDNTIAALTGLKAATANGKILLFGYNGTNTSLYTTDITDGTEWTNTGWSFGADTYNNVAVRNDSVFVLDGDDLKVSADAGETFTSLNSGTGLTRLLGAGSKELYGYKDNTIYMSADGGTTWAEDSLIDASTQLPSTDISFCATSLEDLDDNDYVLLAGNRATSYGDSTAVVWSKLVEHAAGSEKNGWYNIAFDPTVEYPLHSLEGLSIFSYDDKIMAVGGKGVGTCSDKAFAAFYESRDKGITWKANTAYALPSTFDTSATSFTTTVDKNGSIWLICGGTGQVWRGKLNRAGWAK